MGWGFRAGTGNSGNGTTSPMTLAVGAACSVGDRVIVVSIACATGASDEATSSITDSNGFCGTFSKDAETADFTDGTVHQKVSVWSAPVTGAGTPSLSMAYAGTNPNHAASVAAYSGLDTSVGAGAVDITGATSGGQSTNPTITLGATNFANELGIGGFADDGWVVTFTQGTGYTTRSSQAAVNGDSAIEDKDTGASGSTPTMNGTWSGAGSIWGVVGVVYKLAAAGGFTAAFRKTLSGIGSRVGTRQVHGN